MRFPVLLLALVIAPPAAAQDGLPGQEVEAPQPVARPAEPAVAGQRQSSEQVAREAGITPMARVGGRIENRVQSRINNRLGRNYLPAAANMTAPFAAAGEQARRAGRQPRR